MKAEEKTTLFNLLKTADSYYSGYTSENYANTPDFSDDVEVIAEKPVESQTNTTQPVEPQPVVSSVSQSAVSQPATTGKITLSEIKEKIQRCTRCQLARTRTNVVPGQGVENPLVLVVGEGPGEDEDLQGFPFVGKAGVLLDKMLGAIQLDRKTNCYIANIVKCRPPQNRDPSPEEQAACISFLEAQIHVLKPKMILCMGRIAAQKILDSQAPLANLRGSVHDYKGTPVMVTYHPSALLRNEDLKRPAWEDLKQVRKNLDQILNK